MTEEGHTIDASVIPTPRDLERQIAEASGVDITDVANTALERIGKAMRDRIAAGGNVWDRISYLITERESLAEPEIVEAMRNRGWSARMRSDDNGTPFVDVCRAEATSATDPDRALVGLVSRISRVAGKPTALNAAGF